MRTVGALACGLVVLVSVLALAGDAAEKWGPFRGQFIDVESGQPIAGAVVLVAWFEADFQLVQTNQRFYDAREAVTGPDGRFEIPRVKAPAGIHRIFEPEISYFAPGYIVVDELVVPRDGQAFVADTTVHMRRARNRAELLAKSRGYASSIPAHKMTELLRAINDERRVLGLSPETGGHQ